MVTSSDVDVWRAHVCAQFHIHTHKITCDTIVDVALSDDEKRERREARRRMTELQRARSAQKKGTSKTDIPKLPVTQMRAQTRQNRTRRTDIPKSPRDRRSASRAGWAARRQAEYRRRCEWLAQRDVSEADAEWFPVLGIAALRREAARRCAAAAAEWQRENAPEPNPRWRYLSPRWHEQRMSHWPWESIAHQALEPGYDPAEGWLS